MNKFNPENIILISLEKLKKTNCEKLLKDNGYDGKICPIALDKLKSSGYLKLWLDSKTFEVMAFTHESNKREVQFNIDYITHFKRLKPISMKKKTNNYDIDQILDKISVNGLQSLNTKELNFLKSLK